MEALPVQDRTASYPLSAPDAVLSDIEQDIARLALSWTDGYRYRRRYELAGSPYGPSDEGMLQWLRETALDRIATGRSRMGAQPL